MKTEVYSWRVSPEVKMSLEREARRRKISVSSALELAAREWLQKSCDDGEEEQLRLRNVVSKLLGTLDGGDPHRSEQASATVRQKLRKQYGR